jgi:cephalosporin hydroxylase
MNIDTVREMQKTDSDLSDHHDKIYLETLAQKPRLIVELGVCNSGNSARIFSLVNEELGSRVVRVDVVRYPYDFVKNWQFFYANDVAFAERLKKMVRQPVDVILIDTSHVYEHTCREIEACIPLLAPNALAKTKALPFLSISISQK